MREKVTKMLFAYGLLSIEEKDAFMKLLNEGTETDNLKVAMVYRVYLEQFEGAK